VSTDIIDPTRPLARDPLADYPSATLYLTSPEFLGGSQPYRWDFERLLQFRNPIAQPDLSAANNVVVDCPLLLHEDLVGPIDYKAPLSEWPASRLVDPLQAALQAFADTHHLAVHVHIYTTANSVPLLVGSTPNAWDYETERLFMVQDSAGAVTASLQLRFITGDVTKLLYARGRTRLIMESALGLRFGTYWSDDQIRDISLGKPYLRRGLNSLFDAFAADPGSVLEQYDNVWNVRSTHAKDYFTDIIVISQGSDGSFTGLPYHIEDRHFEWFTRHRNAYFARMRAEYEESRNR